MREKNITRKEFLHHMGIFALSGMAASLSFMGCSDKKEQSDTAVEEKAEVDPCEDLSQLSQEDLEIRDNFEYVGQTPIPEQRCDNCELWIAPVEGNKCGRCQIMNGPVKAEGYCTAWIAQEKS